RLRPACGRPKSRPRRGRVRPAPLRRRRLRGRGRGRATGACRGTTPNRRARLRLGQNRRHARLGEGGLRGAGGHRAGRRRRGPGEGRPDRAGAGDPAEVPRDDPPRPAAEISLAQVIRAVDGPIANVRGMRPEDVTYRGTATPLREVWIAVRANLRAVLERVTLAD